MVNEGQGVAYALWREVESKRLERGMTKAELAKRSGLARTTINDLRSSTGVPRVTTVHALADLLHIDRREAESLAGLRPAEPGTDANRVDVRAAIRESTVYTEQQRQMLLAMVDTIEKANRLTGETDEPPRMRVV